jgi:hypothetical protein
MAIEKKQMPFVPWKGLFLDGVTVPGGLSKAENVIILPDGTAERRLYERSLADSEACVSGRGTRAVYELLKNDGTRYVYAALDYSGTGPASFGTELVDQFASWIAATGWSYGSSKWTHSSGTTALSAIVAGPTNDFTPEAGSEYRLVTEISVPSIYGTSSASKWTYAHTDSTYDWTTKGGNVKTVWLNTWTHASGSTDALNASKDFLTVVGASYVVKLHVTHTSGTGLTVICGGITAGTISSSGYHTYIVRFCTDTTGLRLVPSSDWVGSINKTYPRVPNMLDNWCSVVRLLDPAGPNTPSNYDFTESPHLPKAIYYNGAELLYWEPTRWYAEAESSVSQSVVISLGGTTAGTVTASGVYTYDVTATNTDALKYTPTTSWTGSVVSASVQKITPSASADKMKIIGGEVTGTTDYEVVWSDILTELTTGDDVRPQFSTLQDRTYLVDGTNPNRFFEDASDYYTPGCPAPKDAPVTADASGGELTAGTYNVYYTYVKRYSDSYVVEGNPSPASNTVVSNNAISVNVLACTEDDVSHIRVYRTLYGEPGSYAYYCGEWLNETATITLVDTDDSIRDTLSTLEFDHDMPPLGKYVLGAGSRLWVVDTDGTLHWSKLDQPELMPSANYTTFDPKDGDEVMGLCPLRKNILVFKRRRTWILDMFSQTVDEDGVPALSKDVVSSVYGCVATGSIQPVGTDSAIWLSHAGFILYNGGSIRNISAGGRDADGNATPSRIQSVINSFMQAGAENFIDSAYHSARQLYHVNFLYRNAAGTAIASQRHFCYNLASDTWTEFVYRDDDGNKLYETNFAMAHDSYGNEVILIPYLNSTTGMITYVYQGEYTSSASSSDYNTWVWQESPGDSGDREYYHAVVWSSATGKFIALESINGTDYPSDTMVFSHSRNGEDWSRYTQSLGSGSWQVAFSDIIWVDDLSLFVAGSVINDPNPGYPTPYRVATSPDGFTWTPRETPTHVVTVDGNAPAAIGSLCWSSDLTLICGVSGNSNPASTNDPYWSTILTSPDGVTWTKQANLAYYVHWRDICWSSDLGQFCAVAAGGDSNPYMAIVGTSTDGASWSISKISETDDRANLYSVAWSSSLGIYCAVGYKYIDTVYYPYIVTSSDGETWTEVDADDVVENLMPEAIVWNSDEAEFCIAGKFRNTDDNNIGFARSSSGTAWTEMATSSDLGISSVGSRMRLEWSSSRYMYILMAGYYSAVYRMAGEMDADYPEMTNTRIDIVSNYNDLGSANEKRICRVYLPVESEYATQGVFRMEPDYAVNDTSHSDGESSQPSGSVASMVFSHGGGKTWVYSNDSFTSTTEPIKNIRIDVGARGKGFRYAIRMGDVPGATPGTLRIKPPYVDVQILSKQ